MQTQHPRFARVRCIQDMPILNSLSICTAISVQCRRLISPV
jgi:hypothetical protein